MQRTCRELARNPPTKSQSHERRFALLDAAATATKAELHNPGAAVCAPLGALGYDVQGDAEPHIRPVGDSLFKLGQRICTIVCGSIRANNKTKILTTRSNFKAAPPWAELADQPTHIGYVIEGPERDHNIYFLKIHFFEK